MSGWRNIPTKYKWTGDSVIPVTKAREVTLASSVVGSIIAPTSPPTQTPTQQHSIPIIPSSSLEVVTLSAPTVVTQTPVQQETAPTTTSSLTTEEQAASAKMEEALDKILAILGQKQEVIESSSNLAAGVEGPPLWENQIQDLKSSGAPIYPEGRPVNNPNHLMLFLWNGAKVMRSYTSSGWVYRVRRIDGKQNPVPEKLAEAFISSGNLTQDGSGNFVVAMR
jgi:hypothetical protein